MSANCYNHKKHIYIFASQVAACVGRNPYKSRGDAFMEVLQRVDPVKCTQVAQQDNYVDDKAALETAVQDPQTVQQVLSHAAAATNHAQVEGIVKQCIRTIEDSGVSLAALPDKQAAQVQRAVRSAVQTSVGVHEEAPVFDRVNKKRQDNREPVFAKDHTLHKICMGECNGRKWFVCGRVDGLARSAGLPVQVLEIKNRMRRLFGRVVEYEKIQATCYMAMLDARSALIVEAHGHDMLEHEVAFDEAYWNDVLKPELAAFVQDLADVLDA